MAHMKATDVVRNYNRALEARDFESARRHLADDLHFEGPIDRFDRADDYVAAITRLYGMVTGVEQRGIVAEGDQVALFTVLDTPVARAPVAEWYRIRDGKIVELSVYFDARPFSPPGH